MRRVRNFRALVLLDQTFGRSLPCQAASNADEYRTRSYPAKVQVLSCHYGRAHELSTFRGEANSAPMFRLRGHKRSRTEKGRARKAGGPGQGRKTPSRGRTAATASTTQVAERDRLQAQR